MPQGSIPGDVCANQTNARQEYSRDMEGTTTFNYAELGNQATEHAKLISGLNPPSDVGYAQSPGPQVTF